MKVILELRNDGTDFPIPVPLDKLIEKLIASTRKRLELRSIDRIEIWIDDELYHSE